MMRVQYALRQTFASTLSFDFVSGLSFQRDSRHATLLKSLLFGWGAGLGVRGGGGVRRLWICGFFLDFANRKAAPDQFDSAGQVASVALKRER